MGLFALLEEITLSGDRGIILPGGIPVECKLLRYWRANGDPEGSMPKRVFSPIHDHTLPTDYLADRIVEGSFSSVSCLDELCLNTGSDS